MKDINQMTTHDIAQYLRQHRNCAFILWQTSDVIAKGDEMGFDIDEFDAADILADINRQQDCEYGITWDHIEQGIQFYYA